MMTHGGVGNDQSHSAPMSEINTTPLVDVMLVLLVIFIITAPLLTHAVKIDLPQASSKAVTQKPDIVTLSIDANGQWYWNDQALDQASIADRFKAEAARDPQPDVHIRADESTRYQVLAEVMAEAQNAGIKHLGFVSEPK
ncbi:biopolymer transport protein ExbD [Novimethylophilus kurashikiensis]|uniref:Biopolymer transport protein ExbD n=1 Tax=Novimethylophilus kurashikiensis TaxID=1825523 RepID=A0A2R5F165_9PROT|nr:biopolymer transporter ExbD [Novimethylophilus kurashikiensis]GBG12492.1 biopolymer transport protein ExbD [Novimethylophilus kurashikiensis]